MLGPKLKTRNGYRSLEALDPRDGGGWDLLISMAKVERTGKRGMGPALELARTVPAVLGSPAAIFKGVRDQAENAWLCYSGVPDLAVDFKTARMVRPWAGQVFLVFVTMPDRVIYQWYWAQASAEDPGVPEGHETRFRERVR